MNPVLSGMQIAILVTDGFEQSEFTGPKEALEAEGAITKVISDHHGQVQGMNHDTPADQFTVDLLLSEADPKDFDAVLLPGGAVNSGRIRNNAEARQFVQSADQEHKPIAVICHGGWLLASAGLVDGRTMTSWPEIADDLRQAGANWVDEEVVRDGNWVSSRKPADIPAFNREAVALIAESLNAHLRGTPDQNAVGLASS